MTPSSDSPRRHTPVSPEADRPPKPNGNQVKSLLVDFRSGEAVERHPKLVRWLNAGWQIRRAVPRVGETGSPWLLVELEEARDCTRGVSRASI